MFRVSSAASKRCQFSQKCLSNNQCIVLIGQLSYVTEIKQFDAVTNPARKKIEHFARTGLIFEFPEPEVVRFLITWSETVSFCQLEKEIFNKDSQHLGGPLSNRKQKCNNKADIDVISHCDDVKCVGPTELVGAILRSSRFGFLVAQLLKQLKTSFNLAHDQLSRQQSQVKQAVSYISVIRMFLANGVTAEGYDEYNAKPGIKRQVYSDVHLFNSGYRKLPPVKV